MNPSSKVKYTKRISYFGNRIKSKTGGCPSSLKNEKNGFALTWVTNYSTNELTKLSRPILGSKEWLCYE